MLSGFKRFLVALSRFNFGFSPEITWGDLLVLKKKCRKGDILFGNALNLFRFFVPGTYVHAALVLSKSKIIEADEFGINEKRIEDFFYKENAGVALYRPLYVHIPGSSRVLASRVCEKARSLVGVDYDFVFSSKNEAYYCTELIAIALEEVGFKIERHTENNIVFATDIMNVCEYIHSVPLGREDL